MTANRSRKSARHSGSGQRYFERIRYGIIIYHERVAYRPESHGYIPGVYKRRVSIQQNGRTDRRINRKLIDQLHEYARHLYTATRRIQLNDLRNGISHRHIAEIMTAY